MLRLMLSDCQNALAGRMLGDDVKLASFSIDTRTLSPGDLYIAISGDRFDGHEYVSEAQERGAAGLIVHQPVDSHLPQLHVDNTRVALSQLAQLWARGHQIPTIGVTGSNGKTTVKEIIAGILSQFGPVLATEGNLNNDIGVPLTLLRLRQEHRYAVIEMGANHAGEISALAQLVEPDVALITNVGAAHIEGFGSIDGVAAAKAEIFEGVATGGWAVINADDTYADMLHRAAQHCSVRTFGLSDAADVNQNDAACSALLGNSADNTPRFALLGEHNILNALAAVAAVQCLDVQSDAINQGLANIKPVAGRLELKLGQQNSTLIDDTYNANPVSARAAIDVLASCSGTRCLVLGEMAELGDDANALHAQVGEYAKSMNLDALWTVGELARHASEACTNGRHFESQQALLDALLPRLSHDTTVLVKGSRSSEMERVIKALQPGNAQIPVTSEKTIPHIDLSEAVT